MKAGPEHQHASENGWKMATLKSVLLNEMWKKKDIKIKLPDIYQNTTCGLCGNSNVIPDDLHLPNGPVSSDPFVSWWFTLQWRM